MCARDILVVGDGDFARCHCGDFDGGVAWPGALSVVGGRRGGPLGPVWALGRAAEAMTSASSPPWVGGDGASLWLKQYWAPRASRYQRQPPGRPFTLRFDPND